MRVPLKAMSRVISKLLGLSPPTFKERAKPEIGAKCRLGCANCHFEFETLPEMQAQKGRLKAMVERVCAEGGVRAVTKESIKAAIRAFAM